MSQKFVSFDANFLTYLLKQKGLGRIKYLGAAHLYFNVRKYKYRKYGKQK